MITMHRPLGNHVAIRRPCMKTLNLTMKCIRFHECMGILPNGADTETRLRWIISRGKFARCIRILHPFLNRSRGLIPLALNGFTADSTGKGL